MRNEPELYKQKIRELVADSKKDIPDDFVIPNAEDVGKAQKDKGLEEDDFWIDSDGESFGGDDDDFEEGSGEDQEFEDEDGDQNDDDEDEDDKKAKAKK
jgi:ubiquitin-conjugating enzyme E2 R